MGYCDGKPPDGRIAEIKKTGDSALPMPDPEPCEKCGGMGEVVILNDEGKVVGSKVCDECGGTGVKP